MNVLKTSTLVALAVSLLYAIGTATTAAQTGHRGGKRQAAKPTRTIDLRICPVTGESVAGAGGGSVLAGKYRIHFCCAGCKEEWAKMPASDRERKIADLARKLRK